MVDPPPGSQQILRERSGRGSAPQTEDGQHKKATSWWLVLLVFHPFQLVPMGFETHAFRLAFLESTWRQGHEFWFPGAFVSPLLETANWYSRPHDVFGDEMFHRVIVEAPAGCSGGTSRSRDGRVSGFGPKPACARAKTRKVQWFPVFGLGGDEFACLQG